jgi:hypothetical protein
MLIVLLSCCGIYALLAAALYIYLVATAKRDPTEAAE